LDVELRRVQADRLLQTARTEAAVFELKRVLGMKSDAPLTVRDTFEALVQRESAVATQLRAVSTTVEQRADVREAAARIETAVAKIDRAQSEGRFDVSLFGNYMRMNAGFPQRGFAPDGSLERVRGHFNYWSAGARVTIPVLNRNQGDVAVARAERAGAAAAHDAARLAAEAEVASARARDERAKEAVKIYGAGAQTLARRNLAVIGQSYELGRVTAFEVLAERRRYLDVERAYTEALRAAYEARTALNRALGEGR
jgi:cobalt-zinc-cadmium efflux system outer membrane protein